MKGWVYVVFVVLFLSIGGAAPQVSETPEIEDADYYILTDNPKVKYSSDYT